MRRPSSWWRPALAGLALLAVALGGTALASGVVAGDREGAMTIVNLVPDTSPGAWEFPDGVSYPEALTAVFVAERRGGTPAGARRVEPLPHGTVALIPDAGGPVVIDLSASYGYDPATRERYVPSVRVLPGTPLEQVEADIDAGMAIPRGVALDIPILPDCMRIASRTEPAVACGPEDQPLRDADLLAGPPID